MLQCVRRGLGADVGAPGDTALARGEVHAEPITTGAGDSLQDRVRLGRGETSDSVQSCLWCDQRRNVHVIKI